MLARLNERLQMLSHRRLRLFEDQHGLVWCMDSHREEPVLIGTIDDAIRLTEEAEREELTIAIMS
jgi:hypothetical protein